MPIMKVLVSVVLLEIVNQAVDSVQMRNVREAHIFKKVLGRCPSAA